MKYSAQEEYGIRCLLTIARTGADGSLTIPEIAKIEGLTQPHVAKLLAILRKASFIKSTRGQLGGYRLAKPPSQIIVGDVLATLGGKLFEDGFCDRHSGINPICAHQQECSLHWLWSTVQEAVDTVLSKVTLFDLLVQTAPNDVIRLEELPRRPIAGGVVD